MKLCHHAATTALALQHSRASRFWACALATLLVLFSAQQAAAVELPFTYSNGDNRATYVPANGDAPQTITLTINSGTATEAGTLCAGFTIQKLGSGTLVFTGTLSNDAGFILQAGTFIVGNGGTQGVIATRDMTVYSGTTLAFNRSDDIFYYNTFRDAGNIAQNGTGTLTLASGTFAEFENKGFRLTGDIKLNAGTVALGSAGAIGTTSKLVFNGGALRWTAANTTDYSARFSNAAGQQYRLDTGGQNVTLATALTSAGGSLTKLGAGTLTLSVANTFGGGSSVNAGTLLVANDSALGSGTVTLNGGTLASDATRTLGNAIALTADSTFGGSNALTFSGTVTLTGSSALNVANTSTPVISGAIGGSGVLNKTGAGSLVVSGINNFSGGTLLTAGTLVVANNAALGTGTLSLNGGTLASDAARTISNAVSLDSDSTIGGSQALTLSGNFTLAKNRDITVSNTATTTISGVIGESVGGRVLAKYGSGELILSGANTYSGGTYIGAGTVRINNSTGSVFGSGAITVGSGATLTGAGNFSGAFQNNGIYSPGSSPTLATLATFNQGSSGTLIMELEGLARGTGYDAMNVSGSLTFGGTLQVSTIGGFSPAAGNSFNLFDWGSASGVFSTLTLPGLDAGLSWDTSSLYTTGVLSVSGSAVPEPSTYAALLGTAALGFAAWRRRRRIA